MNRPVPYSFRIAARGLNFIARTAGIKPAAMPAPGRGIVIGETGDGRYAVTAYFIMGRSANSRNRVFVTEGEGIRTQAFDPEKLEDPSLIIYAPVRVLGNKTIVTNGDQTDTIYEGMDHQLTFEQSLRSREFEPDAPNYAFYLCISEPCSRNGPFHPYLYA